MTSNVWEGKKGEREFFPTKTSAKFLEEKKTEDAVCFRGLCAVFRAEAGPLPPTAGDDSGEQQQHARNHHSHWRDDGEPSRCLAYYDAASLYPSSGESLLKLQGGG